MRPDRGLFLAEDVVRQVQAVFGRQVVCPDITGRAQVGRIKGEHSMNWAMPRRSSGEKTWSRSRRDQVAGAAAQASATAWRISPRTTSEGNRGAPKAV